MRTIVVLPYASVIVEDGKVTASFDQQPEEVARESQLDIQLWMPTPNEPGQSQCVMSAIRYANMWLTGDHFFRLLFTINKPGDWPAYMSTLHRYEVKVYRDRMEVTNGWKAKEVLPVVAKIYYNEVSRFDATLLIT